MDSTDAPQIIEHIHKSLPYTPYDNKWVPVSARVVSMGIRTNAKGAITIYQLNNGDLEVMQLQMSHLCLLTAQMQQQLIVHLHGLP